MKIVFSIAFCIICVCSYSQNEKAPKNPIDMDAFNEKVDIVEWLFAYDMVAWQTTDLMMEEPQEELAKLGAEWFCLKDMKDTLWHAFYGKFENDKYILGFHFVLNKNGEIKKAEKSFDVDVLSNHARAIVTARKAFTKELPNTKIIFNHFIQQQESGIFRVWLFPAFQPNGIAVYGGEFIYDLNSTGSKIIKTEHYFKGELKGYKIGDSSEAELNYQESVQPTLGAMFFVWYYKEYFDRILINNKKTFTTVIQMESNKLSSPPWMWAHVIKDSKNKN